MMIYYDDIMIYFILYNDVLYNMMLTTFVTIIFFSSVSGDFRMEPGHSGNPGKVAQTMLEVMEYGTYKGIYHIYIYKYVK